METKKFITVKILVSSKKSIGHIMAETGEGFADIVERLSQKELAKISSQVSKTLKEARTEYAVKSE